MNNLIEIGKLNTESRKKEYFNEIELAQYWSVSRKLLQKFRQNGNGPKYIKIGGAVRYKSKDIIKYEELNQFAHTSQGSK